MSTNASPYLNLSPVNMAIFTIWLFHLSALAGILLFDRIEWFISKTPLNLGLCFLLLIWVYPIRNFSTIRLYGALFTAGMLAEIIGVQTGALFGSYVYGENLGPKLLGVPLMIGINWAVLTFITGCISKRWITGLTGRTVAGTALMLVLDLFLEGIAPAFDFWVFAGGEAPLYNYLCWGILALAMQYAYHLSDTRGNYPFSLNLYLSQALFFLFFYLKFQF